MKYFIPPWDHQGKAIDIASPRDYYGLLFDPGTGKTATAINIYRHWCYQAGERLKGVIICPPVVIKNWKKEFEMHSTLGDYIIPLVGTGIQREKIVRKYMHDKVIFVTNYETLLMNKVFTLLYEYEPRIMILDESHKIKSYKAKRSKAALVLGGLTEKRLILTGTPVLNNAMDIFMQYRFLDRGERFGDNFHVFRNTFFFDKNAAMPADRHFPNWVPNNLLEDELTEKIFSCAMTVKKEECLDLPPLITQDYVIELAKEQQKHYSEMKKDLITYLDDDACVAPIAMVKALRLMQISSGHMTLDTGEVKRFQDIPRDDALRDLLETITPGHKIIVWACFKENYKSIAKVCDKLKIKYCELHGGVSGKRRDKNITEFTDNKSVRVLIGHPLSGGIGVNLQAASYSLWYSRNFSLEAYLQARARNHRAGSEIHDRITEINLLAKNTIDYHVLEALRKKQSVAESVLDLKKLLAKEQADC